MAGAGDDVIAWLRAGAPGTSTPDEVLAETCERLGAAGAAVARAAVYVATLHPNVHGRGFVWQECGGVEIREVEPRGEFEPESFAGPMPACGETT